MMYPPLTLGYTVSRRYPVPLDPEVSFPHRLLVGGTGMGKTSFLMGLVYQQLRRAGGVIYVDGKANPQNVLAMAHLAQCTGRWSLLRAIAPGQPWSHLYNPLHNERELDEAVNFLLNLLPPVSVQSEAQHYRDLVQSFLLKGLGVLRATGKTATLKDLLSMMTAPPQVVEEKFLADLKGTRHEERLGDLYYLTREILKKEADALSGLIAQLQSIVATDLGNFMSTVYSDIDFLTAVDLGAPVYVALPTSANPARADALGRAFLADILAVMASLTSERRPKPTPPALILLDEFGSFVFAEFAQMFAKAREAGVHVIASVTNISELQASRKGLNDKFPDELTGNADAIFMRSLSPETLEWAERYFLPEKQMIPSRRESYGSNLSGRLASAHDRFWNPQQAVSHTIFDQATEKREPRLPRERIPELGLHEAFLFFRGRPTLVALVYYFLPAAVALRNVAKVLPSLLRSPQQPVAFGEYQLSLQIAAMSGSRTEKRVQDGTRDGVLTPESKKPRSTRSKTGTKQTP